jgi:dihydrofolate reductase
MKIKIIAAIAKNGVIGSEGILPWHIPNEMKFFSRTTRGHALLMGNNTWKSLPIKPLPSRINLVMTKGEKSFALDPGGPHFINDISQIEEIPKQHMEFFYENVFVIGGASIYKLFLDKGIVDEMILSNLDEEYPGDCYFPEFTGFDLSNSEKHNGFTVNHYVNSTKLDNQ